MLFLAKGIVIKADNVALIKDGKILFETVDTKASSGIRWKTVGFTITREKCLSGKYNNGGYPTKLEHAAVFLKDEWKQERDGTSSVHVTFTIPQSVVSTALMKAGMGDIKHDDILYLHGIFQVTHNGKNYGSKKYSLPAISTAESWVNPDDFRDRFDVRVFYKAPDEPISIQYKTSAGEIIETSTYPQTKWVKPGSSISVSLAEEKRYQGKKYKIYKSYTRNYLTQASIAGSGMSLQKGDSLDKVKNRTVKQRIGGTQFVAVMKQVKEPKLESDNNLISEWEEPVPKGVIEADVRGNPIYDVEAGIPATESLYLNVISKEYLFGYEFTNVVGEKTYEITVSKTYHLKWNEITYDNNFNVIPVPKHTTKTITKTVTVKREYSYWKLKELEYYKIKDATIENGALPGKEFALVPKEYQVPELDYCQYNSEEHIKAPAYQKKITLPSETLEGTDTCPEIPYLDFQSLGETEIGEIRVRNDKLQLGEKEIANGEWSEKTTTKPVKYQNDQQIGNDVLYQNGLLIPKETANGLYETSGAITYESVACLPETSKKQLLSFGIEEMKDVTVHTPVVCNSSVSDDRIFSQLVSPDITRNQLILDRSFVLYMPTEGEHLQIKGYGWRDYGKYIDERQVLIPFDVYKGTQYYPANTWIPITCDATSFYIPIWVKEHNYTLECRTTSISAKAQDANDMEEELANLQLGNYVATCQIPVQVSGRLYGFQITDISDYPNWYSVFRQPGTLKPSGTVYSVGTYNQNGLPKTFDTKKTLPILKGSHPFQPDLGITPTGYTFRFFLETIGELYGEDDYVQLTPTFYYLSKDGKKRQEADIYYSETIDGTYHSLVKVGSELDLHNIKHRYLGNPYTAVKEEEIKEKAKLTGKTENQLRFSLSPMFAYHHVLLSETFRTYTGRNYAPEGKIPAGVNKKVAAMSKQRWYGEYYLPSKVYAVPKGYGVKEAEERHGSFDFSEDFWLKNGYILIQFDIVTVQEKKRHLSYVNAQNAKMGFCNMWKKEGFSYRRTDEEQVVWNLIDGDTFFYQTDQRAGLDYHVGGTH